MNVFDVQVRGAGVVGQTLALALARLGLRVALQTPAVRAGDASQSAGPRATPDVRAYALSPASVDLLRGLKVWDALPKHAVTPVLDMHVHGDAAGHVLDFSAWEQHLGELAWITDAAALDRELAAAVRFAPHITTGTASESATLNAICEGRDSSGRAALGIDFDMHRYAHRAVAARLTSSEPHRGAAHQWFRSPDVLALLPFDAPEAGRSYALVWSLPDARADQLTSLDEDAFEAALNDATAGECGRLSLASPRAAWPLTVGRASTWSGPGWVLLGDAAHVVHPLAGQGLNLGLADVSALVDVIAKKEAWRSLGDERLLRRYARQRAAPTSAMIHATDGLLRLFSHEAAGFRELRNQGLDLANRLTPLKRWLAARAIDS